LKVPFGLLAVIDASLLGWLAQSYTTADHVIIFATSGAILVVSGGVFWINRTAYRRIRSIEDI
jgi:hypothetical protein